ncbi:MAG: fibronectin type III domain-containing protein [Elusimicrobia bacterium]|nr:fibronectin type III domain-containing protein [Elusimicrobiota bacterium]
MVVSLANRQYFARVMALALDGDSTHDSGWTDGTTSTWTAVVGPQEVGVVESSSTLRVRWVGNVGSVSNEGTTRYELRWKEDGAEDWVTPFVWKDQPPYELTAEGLTADTTYVMRLTAKADVGGGWGDVWEEREKVTLATVPVVVDPFTVYHASETVRWDGKRNPVDTEYVVRMSPNSDFQSSFAPVEYEADSFGDVHGVDGEHDVLGESMGKNRAEVLTEGYVSWEPQATDAGAPVLGATGFRLYTDSGTVTWDVGGNPAGTHYKVVVDDDQNFNSPQVYDDVPTQEQGQETQKTYTVTGLTPNLSYYAKVEAHGHNGTVVVSDVSIPMETIAAEINVVSIQPDSDKTRHLKVHWETNNNSPRTRYEVELTTRPLGQEDSWEGAITTTTVANATGHVFEDLISNQEYRARVRAEDGPWSGVEKSTYTWPSVVAGLSAVSPQELEDVDATRTVKFQWGHGTNAVDTSYQVVLSTGAGNVRHIIAPFETDDGVTEKQFNELDGVTWANQKYDVEVYAKAKGNTPDGVATNSSGYTAPLKIQSIDIVNVSSHSFTAKWKDSNDGGVINGNGTQYLFKWDVAAPPRLVGSGLGEYVEEVTSLRPNTTYFAEIMVVKSNESPWGVAVTTGIAVTNPTVPLLNLGT